MAQDTNAAKAVGLAMEAANADTVYRDFYLRRARQLLSPTLDESAYRSIGSTQTEIEEVLRRSRTAALQRDWAQAASPWFPFTLDIGSFPGRVLGNISLVDHAASAGGGRSAMRGQRLS